MPLPMQFPNINSNAIFSDAWAPGAIGFNSAIKYWQQLLNTNARGKGAPQLATANAQSPVGAAYQAQPYDPSADAGIKAYAGLKGGEAGARGKGVAAQNAVQQTGIQGATDVANAYGNSLISHLQGMIQQNAAEGQANAQGIGGALGIGAVGNDVLGALLDPANMSGMFGSNKGPGAFLNSSGQPSALGKAGNSIASMIASYYTGGAAGMAGAGAGGISGSGSPSTPTSLNYGPPSTSFGNSSGPFSLMNGPTSNEFDSGNGPFSLFDMSNYPSSPFLSN